MKESQIDRQRTFPTDDQASIITEPGKGAFDFPAFAITTQGSAILGGWFFAVDLMWHNQLDAAALQAKTERIAVIGFISDQALGFLAWTTPPATRHRNPSQGGFQQLHLRWGGGFQMDSQRNTLTVDHHHPLCAFPPLGFANPKPPFLAGAKLPSAKASLQSNCPRWSSVARKVRQISNHTPSSSHLCKRRQQVAGLGYCSGRSCQRAPVRRIQRMPSSTARFGAQGRPPFFDLGRTGNKGSINFHCLSVSSGFRDRAMIAPPTRLSHNTSIYATPFIGL